MSFLFYSFAVLYQYGVFLSIELYELRDKIYSYEPNTRYSIHDFTWISVAYNLYKTLSCIHTYSDSSTPIRVCKLIRTVLYMYQYTRMFKAQTQKCRREYLPHRRGCGSLARARTGCPIRGRSTIRQRSPLSQAQWRRRGRLCSAQRACPPGPTWPTCKPWPAPASVRPCRIAPPRRPHTGHR